MKRSNKGFTLIELLVVIAIIGILSAIVLGALNSARDKGADAAIESNIDNSRAQAELYYNANGLTYNPTFPSGAQDKSQGMCADPSIVAMVTAAHNAGSPQPDADAICKADNVSWAAQAQLKSGGTSASWYCVDSTGFAGVLANGSEKSPNTTNCHS